MKRVLALFLAFLLASLCAGFVSAAPDNVTISVESQTVLVGKSIIVYVAFPEEVSSVKSMMFDVAYDCEAFELTDCRWLLSGSITDPGTPEEPTAAIAFDTAKDLSGRIFAYYFKVLTNEPGDYEISLSECRINQTDADGLEVHANVTVEAGTISVLSFIPGDVNANGAVNSDDAIHLLRHTMNPSRYTINQNGDMNGDGTVDSSDAIYLLLYVFRPETHPLYN